MIVFPLRDFSGRPALAAVAKRSYRIHRGRCFAEPGLPAIREELRHEASVNPDALDRLAEDCDLFAPLKPSTDVVVSGCACSTSGPVRMLDTAVVVGPLRKHVRVWGHRTIQLDSHDRLRFSEPEPFASLPLIWDHAYGGRDAHVEKLPRQRGAKNDEADECGVVAYPRNGAGRGFFVDIDRERLAGAPAPRLEDPEDAISPDRLIARDPLDWMDRPVAACYEPVDWVAFPRVSWWLGTEAAPPSRAVQEVRRGLLRPQELGVRSLGTAPDPRAYNCAPAGLSGARLRGNERVSLWNLHPSSSLLELDLPGERPSLLVEPAGCGVHELQPTLQTVLIKPNEERVILTWTGTLQVAAPFTEDMCNAMRKAARWER